MHAMDCYACMYVHVYAVCVRVCICICYMDVYVCLCMWVRSCGNIICSYTCACRGGMDPPDFVSEFDDIEMDVGIVSVFPSLFRCSQA